MNDDKAGTVVKIRDDFPFDPKKWPFFYGYIILLSSIIGVTLSVPGQTIGVMPFIDYFIDNFHIGRFQISLCYTVGTILSAVVINRTGNLLDRVGSRRITFISCFAVALILVLISQIDRLTGGITTLFGNTSTMISNLTLITAGFILLRYFTVWGFGISSRTMLMRWFHDKRGRVNSVLYLATSVTFASMPLLLESLIRTFTWRGALLVIGGVVGFVFSLFTLVFFRDNPEKHAMYPDGKPAEADRESDLERDQLDWELSAAQRTYTFWIFMLPLAMFGLLSTGFTFHSVSIFEIAERSRKEAISIFLPTSLLAAGVNLAAGWISDLHYFRDKMKYLFAAQLVSMQVLCLGLIVLDRGAGTVVIIVGYGITRGLLGTLVTVTWPRYFGKKYLGAISSFTMSIVVFSGAIGPFLFGLSFNTTGNYILAIIVCWIILAILLILTSKANKPKLSSRCLR
jgi:MFS family permease